jgi:hypothetical protein
MCVPLAIGLAAASTVATMAGQFMQGQAAYSQAKYEEAGAKANQALAQEQAKQSIELTHKEAAQRYRQEGQLEGQQQAAMAANGVDLTFGSAVSTLKDDKMIAAEDVGNIYTQGQNRTLGYMTDAYNYRLKAQAAKSAASGAKIATGIGMLGTALGGASQIAKMGASANFGGG